jgi:hypothetical protein
MMLLPNTETRKARRHRNAAGLFLNSPELEGAGDRIEGAAEVCTDGSHNRHSRDGNQRGDQTIFNRGRSVLVLQEPSTSESIRTSVGESPLELLYRY